MARMMMPDNWRQDRRWCIGFALLLMVITTLPYVVGYMSAGEDWQFTGFIFGVEDGNSYIAKMLIGASGDWLFRTPFTAMDQDGAIAYLPYILLGKLTSPPGQHEQLVALFHIFRWAGIYFYVISAYLFISLFIKRRDLVRWGTLLVSAGGGLGWLVIFGFQNIWMNGLPLEFYSPETLGFLSLLGLPHLAFSRAFLLLGLRAYILGLREPYCWKNGVVLGLYWLGVGVMQPLTVVTGWAILLAHVFFVGLIDSLKNNKLILTKSLAVLRIATPGVIISAIIVVYTSLQFAFDPVLRLWQGQNKIFSPPIWEYLLVYGWALIFAVPAIVKIIKRGVVEEILIVSWVVIFPLLAYAPYNLQRRLPDGVWTAIIVLVLFQVAEMRAEIFRYVKPVFLQSLFPALLLISGAIVSVINPSHPLFRPTEEIKAFRFLAEYAQKGDVVLAQFKTSNALPAWAVVKVLTGHGPESVNIDQVQPKIDQYFRTNGDSSILEGYRVRFVIWGPEESRDNNNKVFETPLYNLIYSQNGYQIYEVAQ